MMGISRDKVFTRLDPVPYGALQSAYQFARTRGDAYVELHHWLNQVLMLPDSDLHRAIRAFGLPPPRLIASPRPGRCAGHAIKLLGIQMGSRPKGFERLSLLKMNSVASSQHSMGKHLAA